jgi:hypothetical protein
MTKRNYSEDKKKLLDLNISKTIDKSLIQKDLTRIVNSDNENNILKAKAKGLNKSKIK